MRSSALWRASTGPARRTCQAPAMRSPASISRACSWRYLLTGLAYVPRGPASERMPLSRPLGAQVLAHFERTRHGVAAQLSAEAIRKRRSMYFADGARDAYFVAGDGAGEIPRGEVALVSAHKLVALLLHVES